MRKKSEFEVVVERDVVVEARDGTGLLTDVYRPAKDAGPLEGPLPTLLSRTPYGKDRWEAEGRYLAGHGYDASVGRRADRSPLTDHRRSSLG